MHNNTKLFKDQIGKLYSDSYERVWHLKDAYKGETVYIVATGPSLNYIESFDFFKDKLVISIKQALHKIPDSDYHLLNFCNLSEYTYKNPDTIVGWTTWDNVQPYKILQEYKHDFILPSIKLGDGTGKLENSISFTKEWDYLDIAKNMTRPWGPGIMYEMAIPLAVHFGCTKIITVGWDLFGEDLRSKSSTDSTSFYPSHNYKKDQLTQSSTGTNISMKEIIGVIESTESLNYWLNSRNVSLNIVDPLNNNPAHPSINRITL